MAFNLNALKGLFSKLKPAAKTVAGYGDDAAKTLTNGSNLTRVGDFLENAYVDQRVFRIPEDIPDEYLDDMYLASSGKSYIARKDPVKGIQMYTPNAMLNVDSGARRGDVPVYARTIRESAPHTWAMRKDGDYEFPVPVADSSFSQLTDPFDIEVLDGSPDFDAMDIRPERFGANPYSSEPIYWFDARDEKAYYDALSQGAISLDILPRDADAPDLVKINEYLDTLGDPYKLPKSYGRYSIMPSYDENAPIERMYDELSKSRYKAHPLELPYFDDTLNRVYQHTGRRAQDDFADFFESGAYLEPDAYDDFDKFVDYDLEAPDELYQQYLADQLELAMFGKKGPRKSPLS